MSINANPIRIHEIDESINGSPMTLCWLAARTEERHMKIFAIADPHLSLGTPEKGMERFGANWGDHAQKIDTTCREAVTEDDLVLIAGDISWAMKLD